MQLDPKDLVSKVILSLSWNHQLIAVGVPLQLALYLEYKRQDSRLHYIMKVSKENGKDSSSVTDFEKFVALIQTALQIVFIINVILVISIFPLILPSVITSLGIVFLVLAALTFSWIMIFIAYKKIHLETQSSRWTTIPFLVVTVIGSFYFHFWSANFLLEVLTDDGTGL